MRVIGRDTVAYDREHRLKNPLPRTPPQVAFSYVPGMPTSQRLFKEMSMLLGRDIRRYFIYDKDHRLKLDNVDGHVDDLSGLRPSLGEILCSHLEDIESDEAFTVLVKSEIGRCRALLDRQYANGREVDDVLISQGGFLGHLLAMRREALVAHGVTVDTANRQIKELIGRGIGFVPVPYAKIFSGVSASVVHELAEKEYGKVGGWLFRQASQESSKRRSATVTTMR